MAAMAAMARWRDGAMARWRDGRDGSSRTGCSSRVLLRISNRHRSDFNFDFKLSEGRAWPAPGLEYRQSRQIAGGMACAADRNAGRPDKSRPSSIECRFLSDPRNKSSPVRSYA
jgi:hypothetical protein